MEQTPPFDIAKTLLSSTTNLTETDNARKQFKDLVSKFMRQNVQDLVSDSSATIDTKFMNWIDLKMNPVLSENCRLFDTFYHITSERTKTYFVQVRKRKAEEVIQSFSEREIKLQKIERIPQVEFFIGSYIFALVLDYLTIDELLQLRLCCRYMHNTIHEFGLQLGRKFKTFLILRYCYETKRGHCNINPCYKKKCLIAGVANDALNNCLAKHKAKSKKKHIEFTQLFASSVSHFKSSTAIDLECKPLKSYLSAACNIEDFFDCAVIRNINLSMANHEINNFLTNQRVFYFNQFERYVWDSQVNQFLEKAVRKSNENVIFNTNAPQEKLILYFCHCSISKDELPTKLPKSLNEHLTLFIFCHRQTLVIQGDSIHYLARRVDFRSMSIYATVPITQVRRFFEYGLHEEKYTKPTTQKEIEFVQKLQQIYTLLDEYVA